MPDLRQPASCQEVVINKKKWDELPKDLQTIVKWAGMAEIIRMMAYSVDLESKAAEELERKHGVKKNPFFARVLKSQRDFAQRAVPHARKIRPPIEVVIAHYFKS